MRMLKKAYLEITNVCNLSCSVCPGTKRPTGFLSPEQFRTLAEKIRPHTEYLYLHLMGEPLLHPHLEQLLDIAHELEFQVMITTPRLPREIEELAEATAKECGFEKVTWMKTGCVITCHGGPSAFGIVGHV